MAISNQNVITRGATGTFGKQIVFRQRFGQTVMCKPPKAYPPKTPTQLANQERFAKANAFAKAEIADPVKKAKYQARATKGQSAYHVAFRDAFHGAEIKEVVVSEKVVMVKVRNNYSVKTVKVGDETAVFNRKRQVWEHRLSGGEKVLQVKAYDQAGNVRVKELIVNGM